MIDINTIKNITFCNNYNIYFNQDFQIFKRLILNYKGITCEFELLRAKYHECFFSENKKIDKIYYIGLRSKA